VVVAETIRHAGEKLYARDGAASKAYLQAPGENAGAWAGESGRREIVLDEINRGQSVLSQIKDPLVYPQLTYLGHFFGQMGFYRFWDIDGIRRSSSVDDPSDFLMEGGRNLALVLNDLQSRPAVWKVVLENLRLFYPRVEEITTKVQGRQIQI